MTSYQKIISAAVLILFCFTIFIGWWTLNHQSRIAYVRSHELIEKFRGTTDARSEFEKKKASLTANADSLAIDFERDKNHYISIMGQLSTTQRQEQEKTLTQRQSQYIQYKNVIDQKVSEEDGKMMQEVLNQVNAFVEEYALKNNYRMILGTTAEGSLLYGDPELDITDVLVKEMNQHYKGK